MLVKDQMTPNPICGHPEMPITEAQTLMQENHIRHLPVLDEENNLVGLITQRALMNAVPADLTQFSPFVVNYVLAKLKARNIMVKDVITISEDTPFEEAARIMADKRIGCLPVMQGQKLVGIISDNDLFNIMVELLGARREGGLFIVHRSRLVCPVNGNNAIFAPTTGIIIFQAGARGIPLTPPVAVSRPPDSSTQVIAD